MATADADNANPSAPTPTPTRRSRSRLSKAQRYAEQCKPLPAVAGETLEERVDRLDRSIDYLSQCFQDEFEVRDEGNLLVDIITQVLLPFAAIATTISLLYVRLVQWSASHLPNFERGAAYLYLVLIAALFGLMIYARKSGRIGWLNSLIETSEEKLEAHVPERKETLTRNNFVHRWIYLWTLGAFLFFIPLTFIVLRSGVADGLGPKIVIDTANICDGPGRIHFFTGSSTCVEIQEDNADASMPTQVDNAIGTGSGGVISPVETAETPIDAQIAEIRLDMTTTLALAIALLIIGVLVSMALWWWRNRHVRDIELV